MRYSTETKEKAFRLWCEGKSYRDIMAELGIGSINTLWRWANPKGGKTWVERRDGIETKAKQKIDAGAAEKITKMLERHYNQAQRLEAAAAHALQLRTGGNVADFKKSNPDPLALQRLGQALKIGISLQRQARGLPAEGLTDKDALAEYTTEELTLMYEEAIRRSKAADEIDLDGDDGENGD